MSGSNNDKGWTFVNDADLQHLSDDGSSGSSEFVTLDGKDAISYHHKSRSSSVESEDLEQVTADDRDEPRATSSRDSSPELLEIPSCDDVSLGDGAEGSTPEVVSPGNTHSETRDEPEISRQDEPEISQRDEPEISQQDEPEMSDPELVNHETCEPEVLDKEVVSALTCEPEVLDKEVVSALTCAGHAEGQVNGLTDQCSPDLTPSEPSPPTDDDDEAMTDSLESLRDLHSSDGEEDEATEADISGDNSSMEFIPQPSDPASGSTSSIEQLNLSADLPSAEGVAGEEGNSQQEVTLPPLGITNLKMIEKTKLSDSESDFSDIVKIDNIPQDEIPSTSSATEPRRFFRAVDLMQVSASSSSSGNSNLSSRFHFIHPLPGNHRYVYPREEEEDVQSLPGDVDDRVESEISGVAPDDSDIDLSTISYDLDQLEMRGDVIRTYKHRPNSTLNTLLTMLALLSLFTTLGIGIGHYLGTTREVALRGQKGVRLQQIQDEYLQCLRHQDILEAQLTVTDEQKIAAVTAVWKQKYEEMIIENVELDHTLKLLQKQLQDGLNHAHLVQDGLHHAHHEVLDHQDEPKPFVNDIVKIQQLELAESEAKLDERMAEVTQEKAQLAELQAHIMDRHDAIINKETNLEKKKILLSEKEAESIKTTASLNDREMELAERMSAVDERAAELILKEEELQRREMKLEEEKARLSEVTKFKVTDAVLTEDALMVNQEAEVLETYTRPPLERQGHVSNTDSIDEDASLQDLRHLQEQVNLLATENDDLRHQVALLRYSAYQQTDQQVSSSTQMTRELKEQANDLAQENNDLKSVVGKLRYTEPTPYLAVGPSSADESVQSSLIGQELVYAESDPEELQPETLPDPEGATQELPGDDIAVLDESSPDVTELPRDGEPQDPVPSVWFYLNLLVPDVDLSDLHKVVSTEQIANLTQPLRTQIEFIQNATADVNFTATLSQKWEELRDLVGRENTDIAASKVRETVGDIKNIFRSEFMEFKRYVDSEEFRSRKGTVTEGISSVVDKISNSTVVARYQEFVNKTKESVTKLSRKIKKTWHKVKNLTGDFLNKNKALNDFGDTVTKSMSNIGKAVDSGWKKAQKQLKKKGLISDQWGASGKKASKRKGKVWEGKKLYNGKIPQQQHTTYHPNLDESNKRNLPEEGKKLVKKPDHRNKESSSEYDKYEEYWEQAEFEPDDFLQEGFFEGNNRQWHKHEKKARKLHGRLQRLNDDIFLAMDDDDVEDIYEDFEDLQEDVDDMEQPEQLMAWLTCQVRWWKSRLYRKHSNEDLVKGCGRHMMQWQLTALCRPCQDHGIKCNKRQKAANAGPFCHYYQTVILPRTNEKLPVDSDRCDGDLSQRKVLRVSLDSDQTSVEGEVHNQYGSLRYSLSLDEPDVEPAVSLNTTDEEPSTKWLFERAEARESHHHDGSWMFKRGAKRDFQRNKPWYYERAEDRADHRSDRFQHIHHSANRRYKHHNRGRT